MIFELGLIPRQLLATRAVSTAAPLPVSRNLMSQLLGDSLKRALESRAGVHVHRAFACMPLDVADASCNASLTDQSHRGM